MSAPLVADIEDLLHDKSCFIDFYMIKCEVCPTFHVFFAINLIASNQRVDGCCHTVRLEALFCSIHPQYKGLISNLSTEFYLYGVDSIN